MEILKVVPRGDVTKNVNYGVRTVEFESGKKEYQRKWITPRVTFSFNVEGGKDFKEYLQSFFDARNGNYEPFYWEYEGVKYRVRFGDSSLEFTEIRGFGGTGVVGIKTQIALEVCKDSE